MRVTAPRVHTGALVLMAITASTAAAQQGTAPDRDAFAGRAITEIAPLLSMKQ